MVDKLKIWAPTVGEVADERQFVSNTLKSVGSDMLSKLVKHAQNVTQNTHSPYSNYPVGAAVLTTSGKIYTGANTENVNYTLTVHAEQNAINAALMAGEHKHDPHFIKVIVLVSNAKNKVQPCGGCRQVITEHCQNAVVVSANINGTINVSTSLKTILPLAFTPSALGK